MSKNTNLSFLTDYITADITNGRIGINNASPTVAFDVVGATKITGVLTLTSTISNGTYTYTLPSATGTLALTSALSGYLPLTGGTLTGALTINAANTNIQIGATSSATTSDNLRHIFAGIGAFIGQDASGELNVGNNIYYNSGFLRRVTGYTSNIRFNDGNIYLQTATSAAANSAITWTNALTIALTGAATFSNLITVSGFGNSTFSSAGTGYNKLTIRNTTAGTGNGAQLSIGTDADADQFYVQSFATTFTTSGMNIAGGAVVNGEGPGGLSIAATQSNIGFYTNGAGAANLRMTITSTGNVGIGTTTSAWGSPTIGKVIQIGNRASVFSYNNSTTDIANNLYFNGSDYIYIESAFSTMYRQGSSDGNHTWFTAASGTTGTSVPLTERMRITSGGNVLIGGTSTLGAGGTNLEISGGRAQLVVNSTTATASWFSVYPAGDGNTYILRNTGYSFLFGTATNQATSGFVQQMSISSNGSIGAPSGTNIYNASDVRLKKNISTTTYGLDTISALNPVKFNWVDGFEPTEDGKDMLGFVAQEVQTIIPEAIESFGGNSVTIGDTIIDNPLRVNEKFLIPVLVKAIQELSAEITIISNKIK